MIYSFVAFGAMCVCIGIVNTACEISIDVKSTHVSHAFCIDFHNSINDVLNGSGSSTGLGSFW